MSGALSKRQQARNERAIQDLIKSVPGNNVCADCQARNPGWASWSLGIFLCMRCAALHRKMGTHISKVKSLSMDSWSNEQVENMKRVGNTASNRIYNPNNTRPPIPFDADEADSAMERFIRGKYQDKVTKAPARNNTGSTNSDDTPPPLPPKTGSRFGFRSASSIFPISSKARRQQAAAQSEYEDSSRRGGPPSPPRNKESRVFGASVNDDLEFKMTKLRDMGFRDEKRNMAVLKGLSGNLEKSIETLVRLGEGNISTERGKLVIDSGRTTSTRSALSPTGISIHRPSEPLSPASTQSNNPFDMLDLPPPIPQPQSSQSTGNMNGNNPYQQQAQNTNPFGLAPSQSQYSLNQAFSNMSVSPTQPLFPNHTGGFPNAQQTQQQQLYTQSMTPPVPSLPQQFSPSVIYENQAQQFPVQTQQQPQQNTSYNPFMQQQQQPQQVQQAQQGQLVPPINTNFPSNPYMQQLATPQSIYHSPMEQSPMQPTAFYDNGAQQQQPQRQMNPFLNQTSTQSPQPMQQPSNPFFAAQNNQQQMPQQMQQQMPQQTQQMAQQMQSSAAQQQFNQQAYNYQAQQQQPQYQQQFRQQTYPAMQQAIPDKKSILDLYNYPQMAPSPIQQLQQQDPSQNGQPQSATSLLSPQQQQQQQSMVSSPLSAGNHNPFKLGGGANGNVQSPGGVDTVGSMGLFAPVQNVNGARHVSQESMSVDTGGWSNGRHSPDAWGSISARSMR